MTAPVQAQHGGYEYDTATADDEHAVIGALPAHVVVQRARRFWWWVLGVSAAVSVLGNAMDAWIRVAQARPELVHPRPNLTVVLLPPAVAAGLAALVPFALLVHTHGLALLVQAPSRFGWLSRIVVLAVVILLGAGGFVLSFEALTELAMQAGYSSKLAWLFPVLVDGSIAGATIALLSLPPQPSGLPHRQPILAPVRPVDGAIASPEPPDGSAVVVQLPLHKSEEHTRTGEQAHAEVCRGNGSEQQSPPRQPVSLPPESEAQPGLGSDSSVQDWALVARRLCDGTSRNPEQVATILHLAFDRNVSPAEIAAESGLRDRAVMRLLDDARPYRLIAAATG